MKRLELSRGQYTIVDDTDFEWLKQWKWSINPNGYVSRKDIPANKKIYLHRLINGTPNGKMTDHINGDRLDNRRSNLRTASRSENGVNRKQFNTRSGYKGVVRFPRDNNWRAYVNFNNKQIHLGYYDSPIDAAIAYNNGAQRYYGEFAKLNEVVS